MGLLLTFYTFSFSLLLNTGEGSTKKGDTCPGWEGRDLKSEKKGKGKGFIEPGRSGSLTYTEKSLCLKKASK